MSRRTRYGRPQDERLEFMEDPEERHEREPGQLAQACTPELLWEFICQCRAASGKLPTLLELKARFGGILGPLFCGWELQRRGLLLREPTRKRKRKR